MPNALKRVKAVLAYDGSAYYGFQKQTSTPQTVAGTLEKTLRSLHIDSPVVGSGRTDAGVHATHQVVHFDVPSYWSDLKRLEENLNRKLSTIYIKHISFVSSDFHARFSAKKRVYRYVFKTSSPSLFEQKYIACYKDFDTQVLTQALHTFVGIHDFTMFRKTGTHTHTTVREIFNAHYVQRKGYHFIYFEANGFLRAQVRMMIGAAMMVAQKKLRLSALEEQLHCIKKHTSTLAPAEGLYLAKVLY